ncbi:MAG: hypothetical protein HY927_04670 [Elusimicrobia bacterium]|nr:hypothetical protein [Elusimicrobiota bacterium]
MRRRLFLLAVLLSVPALPSSAAETGAPEPGPPSRLFSIKPKRAAEDPERLPGSAQPDTDLIDVPTTAVLDYGGYAAKTRFFSHGGMLQHVSFGVFHRLNIGASLNVDRLIGSDETTRVRAPNVQAKYRFFDGDHLIPSFAVGFDGQGYLYNRDGKRYNNRHRGFFVVASQELFVPGLETHPVFNISDFDSNSIYGAIPLSLNIRDRAALMAEWDNISDWSTSRINAGLRVYVTPGLHIDFALRGIGQGGRFSDDTVRGPERAVQLSYRGNF